MDHLLSKEFRKKRKKYFAIEIEKVLLGFERSFLSKIVL